MRWFPYKSGKGKDFFRDTLEYFEYNEDTYLFGVYDDIYTEQEDDVIGYNISKKMEKI
jgi:hypothetical protein